MPPELTQSKPAAQVSPEPQGSTQIELVESHSPERHWPPSEQSAPWVEGVGPDPARTQGDMSPGAEEVWTWSTPREDFPEGSYLIRVESHRASESLHYAHHQEKIYVER